MERLAETRQRESPESWKKRRNLNTGDQDTMKYFREKGERELKLKLEEVELKKREI